MAKLSLLLILYASLVFSSVVYTNANVLEPPRRSHGSLSRLIKKRTPQGGLGSIFADTQPGLSPGDSPASSQSADQATTSPTPTSSSSAPSSVGGSSSAAAPSSSGGLLGGLTSAILQSTTSSSVSTSASTSSTIHTSTPAQTTQAPSASTPSQQQQQQEQQQSTSVYLVTASSASTPTQSSTPESASSLSHTAVTVLIIIAVSIGASAIIWTIIRKWKFSPSSNFEDRMQPIDWQPDGGDDSNFPGTRRPLSNASSFQSNPHTISDDHSRAQIGSRNAGSLPPLPDHDFTAGPAHLAPVGGYADLARGVSPEPAMQEALTRAPSINHQYQHDQYGVPLHHGYNGPTY
ncbi:hypothetical protein V8B97DRAFT_623167 [Scleroderma yunnanense]